VTLLALGAAAVDAAGAEALEVLDTAELNARTLCGTRRILDIIELITFQSEFYDILFHS
jgi:hypothetical protein